MKKWTALILVLILILALSGCGERNVGVEQNSSDNKYAVGDHLTFGTWAGESIEWRVLDVDDDGHIMIISEYGLEEQPYNTTKKDVTWETCTLRAWLNETFYASAFNTAEQELIQTADIINDDNPDFGTDGGNNTQDKVFLLSIDEAENYFADDADRMCEVTEHVIEQGIKISVDNTSFWWLRSPGSNSYSAVSVEYFGVINEFNIGKWVNVQFCAVRPVMWISPTF